MAPSKRWMRLAEVDRLNPEYIRGVKRFIKFAHGRIGKSEIRCPCVKCYNTPTRSLEVVESHLLAYGINTSYTFWYFHKERKGEPQSEDDDDDDDDNDQDGEELEAGFLDVSMQEILHDLFPAYNDYAENHLESSPQSPILFESEPNLDEEPILGEDEPVLVEEEPNDDAERFFRLIRDSEQPIYQGSRCSKLSSLVKLLHIKSLGRWSNNSFTMLLQYLKEELLPEGSTLPDSYSEAKKIIRDLGLSYDKIDACTNDCMLYRKQDNDLDSCKFCGASRWKSKKHNGEVECKSNGKKIPLKTMRYFPLKPRLQRLFMLRKTASEMRWHHDKRKDDGAMRHPADSKAWKVFDQMHEHFALEPRNVRLGLATDGFQPFANSKTPYSIWPIILIPYNLPPWKCMKQSNLILSTLIPGPEGPGDAIDVYLQPLIEELKELWDIGVETYDTSLKQNFNLRAAVLWTINDFPAYGMLSGWSTKGKLACPCCNKGTHSIRLANGGKQCFMGHRRYLPINHRWRKDKNAFDGTKEKGVPPDLLSGDEILNQVQELEGIQLTKDPSKKVKISHKRRGDNWNKKSIFFKLPYWRTNLLRHNLDVMHIEKNICDNILGTIMNVKGKTKDNLKSRLDLQAMGIRQDLHPIHDGDKLVLPAACYTLSIGEKQKFCQFLKQIRVPDGFSSSISSCVNTKECKISGLKSHDCHILLQRLIPLAIRSLLPREVCEPLIELAHFFSILCAKTLKEDELDQIGTQIPLTLCKLEKLFPPSFFDVMVHLPIHLVHEAKINGPVQFRWMFFVERQLYTLKSYVRNRARPEGSIAEGFIADECMTLCSRYFHGMDTKFNRPERNYDGGINEYSGGLSIFAQVGRPLGAGDVQFLNTDEWVKAHSYVLRNCEEVHPFLEEFKCVQTSGRHMRQINSQSFNEWFRERVLQLKKERKIEKDDQLITLSRGPRKTIKCYNGFIINGFRFHTERRDKILKTQNSGVMVVGDVGAGNENNIDYYGILTDIIELSYIGVRPLFLFRCKWCDVHDSIRGAKVDEYGFVSVNFKRVLKTNEPFVLANQASQVFYVTDNTNKGWQIVLKTQPRDLYEIPEEDDIEESRAANEVYQQVESYNAGFTENDLLSNAPTNWRRMDVEPLAVDQE